MSRIISSLRGVKNDKIMLEDYDEVIIQKDSVDRYYTCPNCGAINYLCLADEPGMKDDCLYCNNTVILKE